MVRSRLTEKKHADACVTTPCVPALADRDIRLGLRQLPQLQEERHRNRRKTNDTFTRTQTTPYLTEKKPLTPARKTATPAGLAAATRSAKLARRRTTPYLFKNTPLIQAPQTATEAATTHLRCRRIPQLPGPAATLPTPTTPFSRTTNRPRFHNWGISHNIRDFDINGLISNSSRINASGSSRLILWSWPPSCNPY